jgi:rod shape determining protein RodA
MANSKNSRSRNIDVVTFSILLALVAVGWLMVFAVGYDESVRYNSLEFFSTPIGRQTVWVGISFVAFLLIQLIDWRFWQTFAYPIYGLGIMLLVGVLVFGKTINGAQSWLSIGGFTLQPSELAKFGTALAMAAFLNNYSTNLKNTNSQLSILGLLLAPILLILLQPDAGSALVFFSFLILLYREGLPGAYYGIGFGVVLFLLLGLLLPIPVIVLGIELVFILILSFYMPQKNISIFSALVYLAIMVSMAVQTQSVYLIIPSTLILIAMIWVLQRKPNFSFGTLMFVILIAGSGLAFASGYVFNNVLRPHQQDRINVWLRPELSDPRGSLYNVMQSKLAISSGGIQGKGFLNGTMTKLNYVPEQSTDFIFCTVGEEHGFIGSASIIFLFSVLLIRLTILAERQKSAFSRQYIYGIAGILFVHFFINIGMTMGLVPIIGIPLPFISRGGSALLGFSVMMAVILKLDSHRYQI